jgi:hypothetical protein
MRVLSSVLLLLVLFASSASALQRSQLSWFVSSTSTSDGEVSEDGPYETQAQARAWAKFLETPAFRNIRVYSKLVPVTGSIQAKSEPADGPDGLRYQRLRGAGRGKSSAESEESMRRFEQKIRQVRADTLTAAAQKAGQFKQDVTTALTRAGSLGLTYPAMVDRLNHANVRDITGLIENYNQIAGGLEGTNAEMMSLPASGASQKEIAERVLTVQAKLQELNLRLEERDLTQTSEELAVEMAQIARDKDAGIDVVGREEELAKSVRAWESRRDQYQTAINTYAKVVENVETVRKEIKDEQLVAERKNAYEERRRKEAEKEHRQKEAQLAVSRPPDAMEGEKQGERDSSPSVRDIQGKWVGKKFASFEVNGDGSLTYFITSGNPPVTRISRARTELTISGNRIEIKHFDLYVSNFVSDRWILKYVDGKLIGQLMSYNSQGLTHQTPIELTRMR